MRSFLIIDKGRELGEKSVVFIKNGNFKGLGYYNLNHQINNIHILESVITPMTNSTSSKTIIEGYLKAQKGLEVIELKES